MSSSMALYDVVSNPGTRVLISSLAVTCLVLIALCLLILTRNKKAKVSPSQKTGENKNG